MRRFLAVLFACLTLSGTAMATLPTLTGRVVDDAHLLSPQAKQELTAKLAAHEQRTSNQLVVVTVPTLGQQSIEEYGVALGRAWGIGQKGKNNGVLLIVAPNDRAVRIEVGYGLEGTLTDAIASTIIQQQILPAFRQGNMQQGILIGARSILGVLEGDATITEEVQQASIVAGQEANVDGAGPWVLLFFVMIMTGFRPLLAPIALLLAASGKPGLKRWLQASALIPLLWWLLPKYRGGGGGFGGGSGGGSGGGFSGGGGSFGGGGSSGKW